VTVLEAIQRSTEFLGKKGVDSPRLQAELLLADLLQLPRMRLYLDFERALGVTETAAYRELIRRRGQREPLQQILGSTCFCGLEIAVNQHVLVPRPETEQLAEEGWKLLNRLAVVGTGVGALKERAKGGHGAEGSSIALDEANASLERADAPVRAPVVLDFGTGSGCLAVTIAVKCSGVEVVGVDASGEALAVARQNAARHGVAARVHFFEGDGLVALPAGSGFELVLSNPPYIPSGEIDALQPEVRDYEPRQALDGGADGLDYYRVLAHEAGGILKPGGQLMVEFGDGQAKSVRRIFEEQKWIVERVVDDYTQRQRILIARWTAC
jgi:release factor glutamine methyltransferase